MYCHQAAAPEGPLLGRQAPEGSGALPLNGHMTIKTLRIVRPRISTIYMCCMLTNDKANHVY